MTHFLGTHQGKLDKKGRLSVPASFRSALTRLGTEEVVLRPSRRLRCIEALPQPAFEAQARALDSLDPFSKEREDLASRLYSQAAQLRPDAEGRVVVPDNLTGFARMTDSVVFVGLGEVFQIWSPEGWAERAASLQEPVA
ncbi:division/cell wall cluster transcriptional repressor MraZ [Humitalea sp. 24SJ18S-53]|uniref:division/cell wall cluster transcriptional repressor MraZ n=1 Tax=Humitalea sp. 24SJ18S-53 TaxID=3422307 RepID=UPI003D66E182